LCYKALMSDRSFETMDVDDAQSLLAEVGRLKEQTRVELQTDGWQWLLVWGMVCLGAALSASTPFAPWYWVAAVPVALFVTWRLQAHLNGRAPVRRKEWPYWAIGAAMTVVLFGSSFVVPGEIMVVLVWVVFGLGFGGLASLDRQWLQAVLFGSLALGSLVAGIVVEDRFPLYALLGFLYAAGMLATAGALWATRRR
jgi:hypothetical protein